MPVGMNRRPNRFIPSIGQFLFLVVFLFLCLSPVGEKLLADADTGYHIRAGDYILTHRTVPKHDIFSFHSPPIPWTAHEWLSEVVMSVLHETAGLTGIVVFFSFLLALTYSLLYRHLRRYRRNIVFDVLIVLLVLVSSLIHWLARPHVFSLLFMVVFLDVLDSYRNDRSARLFLLPPIMLFWVNLHGGYLGGFILIGVYFLGSLVDWVRAIGEDKERSWRKARGIGWIIVFCMLVSLANPHGYQIFFFPFRLVGNQYLMDHVVEFLPPNFHQLMPFKYILLALLAILAVSRKPLHFVQIVLPLLFLNMALFSARYIPLFAIVSAPVLSGQADSLLGAAREKRWASFLIRRGEKIAAIDDMAKGFGWVAAAVLLVIYSVSTGRIEFRFDEKIKPVAAVEFLGREHIEGRMYDNDEFGDYLIYALYPRYRVFFDGRSDMYGTDRMKEYMKVAEVAPGWEKVIEKYDIQWFFIGSDSLLTRHLLVLPEWKLIYSDNVANIHVKNTEAYRDLIDEYGDVVPVVPKEPGEK